MNTWDADAPVGEGYDLILTVEITPNRADWLDGRWAGMSFAAVQAEFYEVKPLLLPGVKPAGMVMARNRAAACREAAASR